MSKTDLSTSPSTCNGVKDSDESDISKNVHSANQWEKADLGDDTRRSKFLRLMGAAKKEHHGRFVIGESDKPASHPRSEPPARKLEEDLESEFNKSMADHLKHKDKRHRGLGFSGGDIAPPPAVTEDDKDFTASVGRSKSTNGGIDETTSSTKARANKHKRFHSGSDCEESAYVNFVSGGVTSPEERSPK